MARPSRKHIDKLRTQVWYEAIRQMLGLTTGYQLDDFFDTGTDRNWYKYKSGTRVPKDSTLAIVEGKAPGSRNVFDVGPDETLLWQALAAPHDKLGEVFDEAFPDLRELRQNRTIGLIQYDARLNEKLIPSEFSAKLDYLDWERGRQPNAIMLSLQRGYSTITKTDCAFVIAYWRLSHLVGYNMRFANYALYGIEPSFSDVFGKPVGELLEKYTKLHLRY